jgi:hypothetical protein
MTRETEERSGFNMRGNALTFRLIILKMAKRYQNLILVFLLFPWRFVRNMGSLEWRTVLNEGDNSAFYQEILPDCRGANID